jgi:hypothetical protein
MKNLGCYSRGWLAPFEKLLSQAQLDALHQDEVLKEEKYGLGYEVNMTSAKPLDAAEASPQNGRWKSANH